MAKERQRREILSPIGPAEIESPIKRLKSEEGRASHEKVCEDRLQGWQKERLEDRLEDEEERGGGDVAASTLPEEEDVERLIGEAMNEAFKAQGSPDPDADCPGSQTFHQAISASFEKLRTKCPEKLTIGDLGELIWEVLIKTSNDAKPLSMAGKKGLFPLPASGSRFGFSPRTDFLQATMASLNSLYGVPVEGPARRKTVGALKRLEDVIMGCEMLEQEIPLLKFDDFFAHRGLDYSGDEIRLARSITWESIAPSLPKEVGMLDIRDFVSGGILHYINNFTDYLVDESQMNFGKPPAVMVNPSDWENIVKGLVDRGICKIIGENEIFHAHGRPLQSGLFSVSKDEVVDDIEICRLIMNLKPLNSICLTLTGDTPSLPSVTNMGAFYLADGEVLATSSEDVRCFFYLFQVPDAMLPFMSFGRAIPDHLVPEELGKQRGFLTSRVLPMGWVNSVGIAQAVHRGVVQRAMGSLRLPLLGSNELRRDRPFSSSDHLYRVYLDNWDELKKVDRRTAEVIEGTPSAAAEALRDVYQDVGLPRHPKKSTEQRLQAEVQGAWIDGDKGTIADPKKLPSTLGWRWRSSRWERPHRRSYRL